MEPTSANFQQPTRHATAALEWSLIMLIQKTPAEIGGNVWMLGTVDYPLYLVRGLREGAVVEGGMGPLWGRCSRPS